MSAFQLFSISPYPPLTSLHHTRHHHANLRPVTGDWRRHRVFLAVLAAGMFFLLIVLPLWLLHKRSYPPPAPESFGLPSVPPAPVPKAPHPPDDEDSVRFK